MKTNCDITLYSRSIVNREEVWSREVITDVFWEDTTFFPPSGMKQNSVTIFIPTVSRSVTIKTEDVIVKNRVPDTIGSTFTISDLRAKYASTIVVKSTQYRDFGSQSMRHVQVGGA